MAVESLKVVHVVRKWNTREWGGTETYVAATTAELERFGWQSEVHAPGLRSGDRDTGLRDSVGLTRFDAWCPYVGSRVQREALWAVGGNLITIDEGFRLFRDRRIALVHLHTAGRIGGAVRVAMRRSRRPYVLSVHGPMLGDPELVAREASRRAARTIDLGRPIGALVGARRVIDDAAAVCCFNEREHRAMQARVGDRAVRMEHGVDVQWFSEGDPRAVDERWPALRGRRVWLVLGRLSRQKNQRLAVEALAASRSKDAVLVCAGAETDEGYGREVMDRARALGVADRVILLGNVQRTDARSLLARAETVLVPSTHEAFGLVVLEAWAARKPTLLAAGVGMDELADAHGDGRCKVADLTAAAWATALDALDHDARASLGARGRDLVERRYSWERVASTLSSVYERACDAARGAKGRS
jgi:D-inositol-3-phosphate glycosyltransferase